MVDIIVHLVVLQTQTYGVKMDFPFSAVGSVIGAGLGYLGAQEARGQQAQQFQQSMTAQQQQLDFQMAAAHNGIQWRVADAKAAGISPLVALGAPTFNPGAVSAGAGPIPTDPTDYASALGRAGQDISESVGRSMTQQQKMEIALRTSQLAEASKKNDAEINMLNAQANYYNSRAMATPPMASAIDGGGYHIPGQTQSGLKSVVTIAGNPGMVGGKATPADQPYVTREGYVEVQPSAGSPASQGDIFNSTLNFVRNRLTPNAWRSDADKAGIMAAIKSVYPEAVAYESKGLGYYRPIFPAEAVRIPSRRVLAGVN